MNDMPTVAFFMVWHLCVYSLYEIIGLLLVTACCLYNPTLIICCKRGSFVAPQIVISGKWEFT